jgi:hypothetical protein
LEANLQQNTVRALLALSFKKNPENSILSAVAVFKFKNKHSSVN